MTKLFHGPNSQLYNDTVSADRLVDTPGALKVTCRECHGTGHYGTNPMNHCQNALCEDGEILVSDLRAARKARMRRTRVVL